MGGGCKKEQKFTDRNVLEKFAADAERCSIVLSILEITDSALSALTVWETPSRHSMTQVKVVNNSYPNQ